MTIVIDTSKGKGELKKLTQNKKRKKKVFSSNKYSGKLEWKGDPVNTQRKLRDGDR